MPDECVLLNRFIEASQAEIVRFGEIKRAGQCAQPSTWFFVRKARSLIGHPLTPAENLVHRSSIPGRHKRSLELRAHLGLEIFMRLKFELNTPW
jgi:hypothetical protein